MRLRGTGANRDAIGARIRLHVAQRMQTRDVKAGSSYLSQHDLRAHFGLGAAPMASRIDVQWSSGRVETIRDVPANQVITVAEGRGIVARSPYGRR